MLFGQNHKVTLLILAIFIKILKLQANDENDGDKICDSSRNLIVELSTGKLRGKDNGFFYSYESIPYAESPVGELRFEAPKRYTRKWEGILDAGRPPVKCMQWDQYKDGDYKLSGVEDCLTINVYKPKLNADCNDAGEKKKFPVLVLIHGGAFMFGSVMGNNNDRLMRSGRVIVVKMSYRLGPLGFLSTEDAVIPGNFGLKDQRLALQWVKENIENFGGDSEKTMVLGFSAGGAAVHLQMLQPNFIDYAKVAASFSGTAFNPWVILRNSRARAIELARILKCPNVEDSQEIKTCLKAKPAKAIVEAVRSFLVFGYNPFTTFGPVVEHSAAKDAFLVQPPEEIIRLGAHSQIPWLVSYAAQDGGYNAAELLQKSPRSGEELIGAFNDRWYDLAPYTLFFKDTISGIEDLDDYSLALKRRYLGEKDFSVDSYLDLQRMYTDVLFKNGIEKAVRLQRTHSKSPIYAYVYDNPADVSIGTILAQRTDIKLGTTHGDDFFLIFNYGLLPNELRADEQIISQKFVKMLEDFVENSTELQFGSCKFVNNVGSEEDLQLMFITNDACENKPVSEFP